MDRQLCVCGLGKAKWAERKSQNSNESDRIDSEEMGMNARASPDPQMHILISTCTNYDSLIQTITFVFKNMSLFEQNAAH